MAVAEPTETAQCRVLMDAASKSQPTLAYEGPVRRVVELVVLGRAYTTHSYLPKRSPGHSVESLNHTACLHAKGAHHLAYHLEPIILWSFRLGIGLDIALLLWI